MIRLSRVMEDLKLYFKYNKTVISLKKCLQKILKKS